MDCGLFVCACVQMARIEEQEKAIHNLKSNLMDDLNAKGILSDPECQKVIQLHQQVMWAS